MRLNEFINDKSMQNFEKLMYMELEADIAFDIMSIMDNIRPHINNVQKSKNNIFDKFKVKNKKGEFVIPPDKLTEYTEQLTKILDNDVNLNIKKIKKERLLSYKFKAADLIGLEWILE